MFPLIDDLHKIIFFWNPKCACSSVKHYYITINDEKFKNVDKSNVHAVVWCHPFTDVDKYKDYKKYAIVRDPYERAVSAFVTMMGYFGLEAYHNYNDEEFINWFWNNFNMREESLKIINDVSKSREEIIAYKKNPSFRNFVNILLSTNIENMNEHLSPQTRAYFCPKYDKNSFDEIIDIKNLNPWLENLNKKLNLNGEIKNINKVNYNDDTVKMCDVNIVDYFYKNKRNFPKWIYFYDQDIKNKIEKIYASDFNFVGKQNLILIN
ncbi:sulfotransferase protein family [Cotonvirus japonicus]|uniref:Sulfotransferase protein family n=1 Tax=Cotonvirus japonicus TaxID=2811091 RepID=A0ABM7NST3_9VIRU|nr:sulfotransferase protein family [Cotonvirus japonicus]BCS83213.1 sulfotransferase protein family [Cotonvirus japonicus]